MKTQEWKFEDNRSFWLPEARDRQGPWDSEPDKRQWMSKDRASVPDRPKPFWCAVRLRGGPAKSILTMERTMRMSKRK
jgi:hypothetical protein